MAFWSKKKPKDEPMRTWDLPADIGTVSLPHSLTVKLVDNNLFAYPVNDFITLRFSSISFPKEAELYDDFAKTIVSERAADEHYPYYESGDKGILSFEEESEDDDGQQMLVKFWEIGSKSKMVVVSATILVDKLADPGVQDLLDSMPRIIESVTVETGKRTIVPFGPSENAWLEQNLQLAASLGVKYGSGGVLKTEELDLIFSRWTDDDEEKESGESVANALGTAFGDCLVDRFGFEWGVISGPFGTDYVVRCDISETMVFPISLVAKRIERNESITFQGLWMAILDVVLRGKPK